MKGKNMKGRFPDAYKFLTMLLRFMKAQEAWSTWKGHQGHLKENWTLGPWGFNGPLGVVKSPKTSEKMVILGHSKV
jgi:hypothetical protein